MGWQRWPTSLKEEKQGAGAAVVVREEHGGGEVERR
jgi:hypothetical protein